MQRDTLLYLDRWMLAYENHVAERSEPGTANGYYSLRNPRQFQKPNGLKFIPNINHAHLWTVLCTNSQDLTRSVTHTWVGKETLMQKASMTDKMFSDTLKDLELLGFVRKRNRGINRTPQLDLHLVPLLPSESVGVAAPVSLAPEDMGLYVCKAAITKGTPFEVNEDPDHVHAVAEIIHLLESVFPDHASVKYARQKVALAGHISQCVKLATSGEDCHACLSATLTDQSERGDAIFNGIATSRSLGAYILESFPGWWKSYTGQQMDDKVIGTL